MILIRSFTQLLLIVTVLFSTVACQMKNSSEEGFVADAQPQETIELKEKGDTLNLQIDFLSEIPYDRKYYLDITALLEECGELKCMVMQITSDESLQNFNRLFSKYDIELSEHDFNKSFLLVSGESPIQYIEIASIEGSVATLLSDGISFGGVSEDGLSCAAAIDDCLFLYESEKVYLISGD